MEIETQKKPYQSHPAGKKLLTQEYFQSEFSLHAKPFQNLPLKPEPNWLFTVQTYTCLLRSKTLG